MKAKVFIFQLYYSQNVIGFDGSVTLWSQGCPIKSDLPTEIGSAASMTTLKEKIEEIIICKTVSLVVIFSRLFKA